MSIKSLTWNISFGAMSGNDADRSSLPLPETCRTKGVYMHDNGTIYTACLNNVVELIDNSGIVQNYDFVALQEATNWDIIYNKSKELKRMVEYVYHKADLEDMVTFYDVNKYTLLAVKVGNLEPGGGRPYQILFLEGKLDHNFYIFINLHNGHHFNKEQFENKLSENLQNAILIQPGSRFIDKLTTEVDVSSLINGKEFKVIVAGDFNDHGKNYWKDFQPFRYTTHVNLNKIVVKANRQPPYTCCAPITRQVGIRRNAGMDTLYGDYILVSNNLRVVRDNSIVPDFEYDAVKKPTSDHLPVEIFLVISTSVPAESAAHSSNGSRAALGAHNIRTSLNAYCRRVASSNSDHNVTLDSYCSRITPPVPDIFEGYSYGDNSPPHIVPTSASAPRPIVSRNLDYKGVGGNMTNKYKKKYLKYKTKYINLVKLLESDN